MAEAPDLREVGDRIERLLDDVQSRADARLYALVEELVRQVTELYGAGLARVVELVEASAPDLLDRFAADGLLASLLVVHDLHPQDLEARVQDALESVRPFLAHHDGDVELIALDADTGTVVLRLLGSCDGCPSSSVTLQLAVERAITEAAPEIVSIEVDDPAPGIVTARVETPVTLIRKPRFDRCPTDLLEPAASVGAAAGVGSSSP